MKKTLVSVTVRNGDINKAIKLFKNKVEESGHIKEFKERKEYIKPKTKRRTIKLNAIRYNSLQLKQE
jgi:ribosomal protein S21